MRKKLWIGLTATIVLVALVTATVFTMHSSSNTKAQSPNGDDIGTARFWTPPQQSTVPTTLEAIKKARAQGSSSSTNATVPFWSSSFTFNGTKFPYTMVGTNPAAGSATTTIQPVIVPLSFGFSNGVTLDGGKKVEPTLASPIFQNAQFDSGNTQYGDALQRAQFWKDVSTTSADYHVLLGKPTVLPTVSINVPKQFGQQSVGRSTGVPIGLVDINFFYPHVQKLISVLPLPATVIPIFLSYNTFLYDGDPKNCCILGYHDAVASLGGNQLNTYMVATYSDPGVFSQPTLADIHALSHEMSEWMNDPFINNAVPNWSVPSQPQYGCSNALETGDPLVGVAFEVNGYHPQDEVFFSWFARETPSQGIHGRYTYLGTFTTYSPSC